MNEAARIAALETQVAKLTRINAALMGRVERSTDLQGNAFVAFETAIALESMVRTRTRDLEVALDELAATNAALATARDAADNARQRLADAIESINEGFAIFDADDRLVLCNQTYLGLWPRVAARIQPGMTFAEIARMIGEDGGALNALVAPDRWVSERVAQHRVAEGGHVHALADGRWVQINELRTTEGGIVGVYTDITEVKSEDARERARELAERSAILQATLDNIPVGVCVYDADRRLIAFNGPLLATIGLPDDGLPLVMTHASMVATCERVNGPMEPSRPLDWLAPGSADVVALRRHRNGRTIEVRRTPTAMGGMVISFEDIAERLAAAQALRESNEALETRVSERTAELRLQVAERIAAEAKMRDAMIAAEEANRSKTRFLAAASHDLLQPLNAARLFVSALVERRLAASSAGLARQTASALDSIENLLEALLEISKLDAGAVTPDLADFPLAELFAALDGEYRMLADQQGLTLSVPPTDLWVRSDPRLLRRILQNLLSNAVRYTESGRVAMRAAVEDEAVVISVSDSGRGIDPAHHAAIFEEFRRLGSDRVPGIGLGLAIVHRAARMLGHPIAVTSALGEGATFSVRVPIAAASTARLSPARATKLRCVGARTILFVDNEQTILDGMAALMAGWGCEILPALSAEEARARYAGRASSIDLIIVDYHLADGRLGDREALGLRTMVGRDVPVIIITADRTAAVHDRLNARGFHLLLKPVKPAQLRALIAGLARVSVAGSAAA